MSVVPMHAQRHRLCILLMAAALTVALAPAIAAPVSAAPQGRGVDTSFTFTLSEAVIANLNANAVWLSVLPDSVLAPLAQMNVLNGTPVGPMPTVGTAVRAEVSMKFKSLVDKARFLSGACSVTALCPNAGTNSVGPLSVSIRMTQTATAQCDKAVLNQGGVLHPYVLCRRGSSVFLAEGQASSSAKASGIYDTLQPKWSLAVNGKTAQYPLRWDFTPYLVATANRLVSVKIGQYADVRSDGRPAYWTYVTLAV